jgi:hypothetical protein
VISLFFFEPARAAAWRLDWGTGFNPFCKLTRVDVTSGAHSLNSWVDVTTRASLGQVIVTTGPLGVIPWNEYRATEKLAALNAQLVHHLL